MKLIRPFKDTETSWLGDLPGLMRKFYQCIDKKGVESDSFFGGITIFQPGEGSIVHNHLGAEEVVYVISGGASYYDAYNNFVGSVCEGDIVFIKQGEYHRSFNDTEESLVILHMYTPKGDLPNR